MREIKHHHVDGSTAHSRAVLALDEPRFGASHTYSIGDGQEIRFQKGPVGKHGVNGTTEDMLLSVLIDRLEGFVETFGGAENKATLAHLRSALKSNLRRTRRRIANGTEGTGRMKPGDR